MVPLPSLCVCGLMSNAEGSRNSVQLIFYLWIFVVQLIGLGVFARGFFLTRVELPFRSECDVSCWYCCLHPIPVPYATF